MALHSPAEFAEIVDNYIDGWRKLGWMPECRANNLPGWTQGGSSADVIVGHFAMTYHDKAAALGIDLEELYSAMLADAEDNPPEWNTLGRQVDVYKSVSPYESGLFVLTILVVLGDSDTFRSEYWIPRALVARPARAVALLRYAFVTAQ